MSFLFFSGAVTRISAKPESIKLPFFYIPFACRTAPLKNKKGEGGISLLPTSKDADTSKRNVCVYQSGARPSARPRGALAAPPLEQLWVPGGAGASHWMDSGGPLADRCQTFICAGE